MSFCNWIVRFSYWLNDAKAYNYLKNQADEILNSVSSSKKTFFDIFMIFLVLSTIGIYIYDIKNSLNEWVYYFEDFAVIIFIIEWLGRLWTCSSIHKDIMVYSEKRHNLALKLEFFEIIKILFVKKIKFIFSLMSIIDLLAIIPYYRPLRMLRFFLIFRLFKLFRYTHVVNSLFSVFKDKRFELLILAIISLIVLFVASTIMYIVEGLGDNPNLNTFLDAIYWSGVTMSTLGYGDITPTTPAGRAVAMVLMVAGLVVVVLATSVVTSAFAERLTFLREDRFLQDSKKIKDAVVIIGYGKMGVCLAQMLSSIKRKFIVIDNNEQKIKNARENRFLAIQADINDYNVLEDIIINNSITSVAILTDKDSTNLSVLLGLKANNTNVRTIVRANEKSNIKKFEFCKADHVVFPHEYIAHEAVVYMKSPATFDVIDTILTERNGISLDKLDIHVGSALVGSELGGLNLKAYRITLIGVFSKGEDTFHFKPDGKYILKDEDQLVVLGIDEQINALIRKLGKLQ